MRYKGAGKGTGEDPARGCPCSVTCFLGTPWSQELLSTLLPEWYRPSLLRCLRRMQLLFFIPRAPVTSTSHSIYCSHRENLKLLVKFGTSDRNCSCTVARSLSMFGRLPRPPLPCPPPSSYTTAAWCRKTTPRESHTVLETKWSPPVSSLVEISRQKSPGMSPQPRSFPRRAVVQQAFSEGLKPNGVISHVFYANEKGQQHLPGHHGI